MLFNTRLHFKGKTKSAAALYVYRPRPYQPGQLLLLLEGLATTFCSLHHLVWDFHENWAAGTVMHPSPSVKLALDVVQDHLYNLMEVEESV